MSSHPRRIKPARTPLGPASGHDEMAAP